MAGRVTLAQIAARAGVGVATVDRVLNGRAPVREATAQRVLAAAEALGYHAQALMRRRIAERAPQKTLGFILQKRSKIFYQQLAAAIESAAAAAHGIRAAAQIRYVESLSPEALSAAIAELAPEADALAVVAIDHPKVQGALDRLAGSGMPVFALLSPLNGAALSGFIGTDGRQAGRTAGWAMSRLAPAGGEMGILIGSHRYIGQEDREAGFRSYLRECAPQMRLRDSLVYLDDPAVAYEAVQELLRAAPDLTGLYHCGGGVEGAVQALRESGRGQQILYICHEDTPYAKEGMLEGLVDLILATPVDEVAAKSVQAMERALLGKPLDGLGLACRFRVITPENT